MLQITGETWFLGASVMGIQEEVSIWTRRLSKEDHPYAWGGGCHPICWEPDRKHGGRNGEFTLSVERECSSSPAPWHQCSWVFSLQTLTRTYTIQPLILRPMGSTGTVLLLVPLVLGLLDLNWMTLPSLVLQLLGSRSWDIAASITMLTNSYNQSLPLSVCLCIYLSI